MAFPSSHKQYMPSVPETGTQKYILLFRIMERLSGNLGTTGKIEED